MEELLKIYAVKQTGSRNSFQFEKKACGVSQKLVELHGPSILPDKAKFVVCSIISLGRRLVELNGPSMLPDKAKCVVCYIISLALSFWMKHLVIGQLQKPAKFSTFNSLVNISKSGFHWTAFGASRVVHLPKRTIMVLFTISDA